MLLEFRFKNYRSFADENTLSLVAAGDEALPENTVATGLANIPSALRAVLIYGANASGKTNLLRALGLMRGVVVDSFALKPDQLFNVQPFRLSKKTASKPTTFEVSISLGGVRYQYGFDFTPARITREWLIFYEKPKSQLWFERKFSAKGGQTWHFGPHFKNKLVQAASSATRDNALFLSTGVQFNLEKLAPLYNWFAESLIPIVIGVNLNPLFSTDMLKSPDDQKAIRDLLTAADTGISDVFAVGQPGHHTEIMLDLATGQSQFKKSEQEVFRPVFTHQVGGLAANFELGDESQGTQKLFYLAGPLIDILRRGKTLIVDEIDDSLHPLLVQRFIKAFQDPASNVSGAQLICSTHDVSQLNSDFFRRDQFYFTEKNRDQISTLIPLTDFSPRKTEALQKGYLSGRYGALPFLEDRLVTDRSSGKK